MSVKAAFLESSLIGSSSSSNLDAASYFYSFTSCINYSTVLGADSGITNSSSSTTIDSLVVRMLIG